MSSPVVIRAENVSKRYVISHLAKQQTIRDAMHHGLRLLWRRLRWQAKLNREEFWALKDVSFEVKQGEVLGIIGRNGAGKSTLLKILSRITEPTIGRVSIKGRVASLLEVGTGFHPELTGRENIFLNGAILGMHRAEIRAKLDEIIAFAEIDQFIDTPVKRYSSGMYVRLAFAVAAHLEPETLIIDEVLAVGDIHFQKKCLGKIQSVAQHSGRTVLFVSHALGSVNALCTRALLLRKGRTHFAGPARTAIEHLNAGEAPNSGRISWGTGLNPHNNGRVRLDAVNIESNGTTTSEVAIDSEISLHIDYSTLRADLAVNVSLHLLSGDGTEILATGNSPSASTGETIPLNHRFSEGQYRSTCKIPANFLNEGRYLLKVILITDITRIEFITPEIIGFTVIDTGAMRAEYTGHWIGVVRPRLEWKTKHRTRTT